MKRAQIEKLENYGCGFLALIAVTLVVTPIVVWWAPKVYAFVQWVCGVAGL